MSLFNITGKQIPKMSSFQNSSFQGVFFPKPLPQGHEPCKQQQQQQQRQQQQQQQQQQQPKKKPSKLHNCDNFAPFTFTSFTMYSFAKLLFPLVYQTVALDEPACRSCLAVRTAEYLSRSGISLPGSLRTCGPHGIYLGWDVLGMKQTHKSQLNPMYLYVLIVFSRDSWRDYIISHKHPLYRDIYI